MNVHETEYRIVNLYLPYRDIVWYVSCHWKAPVIRLILSSLFVVKLTLAWGIDHGSSGMQNNLFI